MAQARRATVRMTYNGIDAEQMADYLSSFSHTDVASGSSDSISLELSDRDRRWINGWFPAKGDRLVPEVHFEDWEGSGKSYVRECGTFIIDDFSFKGDPITCSIEALALPSTSGFKTTERTFTYETTNLKEIGQAVADRAGLELFYEADLVEIESVAQDKKTDCAFYSELVERFGLSLKLYNNRLVVFDEGVYETKPEKAELAETDFEPGWSWNTTLEGTYTGIHYQYTHTDKDKTFTVDIGEGERILNIGEAANNQAEATAIALAALNKANRGTTTMQITLMGTWRLLATDCVRIRGLGKLDGKYYIKQAVTNVADGTTLQLSLRKCERLFTKDDASISSSVTEGKA